MSCFLSIAKQKIIWYHIRWHSFIFNFRRRANRSIRLHHITEHKSLGTSNDACQKNWRDTKPRGGMKASISSWFFSDFGRGRKNLSPSQITSRSTSATGSSSGTPTPTVPDTKGESSVTVWSNTSKILLFIPHTGQKRHYAACHGILCISIS